MHEDEGRLQLRLKERTDQLADSPKTWESLYRRLPIRELYISNFHSLNSFTEGRLSEKLISLWKKKFGTSVQTTTVVVFTKFSLIKFKNLNSVRRVSEDKFLGDNS